MSRVIADFGELRSALQSSGEVARKRAWRSVYMFFREQLSRRAKTRDPRVVQEWLPYAVGSLERWPDRLRYLPREDLEALLAGKQLGEVMQLVRAVRITRGVVSNRSRIFETPGLTWVRHVTFGPGVFSPHSYEHMRGAEVFAQVTSLEIQRPSSKFARLATLLRAPFAPNLRHLGLIGCQLDEAKLKTLTSWRHHGRLESLDLSHNPMLGGAWGHLADAELPALRALDVSGSWTHRADLERLLGAPWIPALTEFRAARSFDALGHDLSFGNLTPAQIDEIRTAWLLGPGALAQLWKTTHGWRPPRYEKARVVEVIKRLERMMRQANRRDGIQELIDASGLDPDLSERALEQDP